MKDNTINLSFNSDDRWSFSGYELVLTDPQGASQRFPLNKTMMYLGRGSECDVVINDPNLAPRHVSLKCMADKLFLSNMGPPGTMLKDGQKVSRCELDEEGDVEIGSFRLRLVRPQDFWGWIEGYTPPYRGRRWVLREDVVTIGRTGIRQNVIDLEDPTVSRAHATITRQAQGGRLDRESTSSSTHINGTPAEATQNIQSGDIVQLGQQVLRFWVGPMPALESGSRKTESGSRKVESGGQPKPPGL